MKKIYLSLLTIFAISIGISQNLESFEGATGELPECWTSVDADGDMDDWQQISDAGWPAHTGAGVFASSSWNGAPLTPDNWLILPQLDVQTGEGLSWWVAAQDPAYAPDNYSVIVSTTGDAPADFTDVLFTEALTTDAWEERTADISAYEGMQIYIAFRHHDCTDQFYMKLDDVSYPTTVDQCGIIIGLEDNEISALSMYPNPVTDVLNINVDINEDKNVQIVNGLGQIVFSENYQNRNQNIQIDLSSFSTGIYTVTLTSETSMSQGKVMVR